MVVAASTSTLVGKLLKVRQLAILGDGVQAATHVVGASRCEMQGLGSKFLWYIFGVPLTLNLRLPWWRDLVG